MSHSDTSGVIALRDAFGRALYGIGRSISRLGVWLCGLAGTWDAITDERKMVLASDEKGSA